MRATEHGHCKRTSIYRYLFRCLGLKNIFINYYDSKKVDYYGAQNEAYRVG